VLRTVLHLSQMPLPIYRLRRLLAATAVVLTVAVSGMYLYARLRTRDVRKEVPGKIGYDIKQTANGFQFSKSDGKRTLFTVQASNVKEFKLNNSELHNVHIVLYGRDSSRFDQIYGDDFSFNEKTGDVTAKGEVQIDLLANPSGIASPDQSPPKEIKNPIHLKTRDLVFNKDSGNAATDARVDFRTPQATGWAVGVRYAGKANTLTLLSQIHIVTNGRDSSVIDAEHGVITNDPRVVVLEHPQLEREGLTMRSDHATFYLGPDNSVQRVVAIDNVNAETHAASKGTVSKGTSSDEQSPPIHARADQAEFLLTEKQNLLRTGILTGNVHVEQAGPQPMQGDAGRVILDFAGHNELEKVHALDGAHLMQQGVRQAAEPRPTAKNTGIGSGPQDFELTAPIIDFTVGPRNMLERAVTSGAAQITISPTPEPGQPSAQAQKTIVTAGKFEAQFATDGGKNRLSTMHGAPNARVVNSAPGEPDRVSTSESIDAIFLPQGGVDSITQLGNVAYTDNQTADKRMRAWANTAHYTPADQVLVLAGNPRVTDGSMATTAKTIRINRGTGDALAEGDVKSTYSDLKEQPNGALLASSSPIHVTARSMTAHNNSGIALYTGNARLWQDANIIEAPSIQFDRDHRFVIAQGAPTQPARTILVQTERSLTEKAPTEQPRTEKAVPEEPKVEKAQTPKGAEKSHQKSKAGNNEEAQENPLGESSPVTITALKLTYADSERKVHYEGGVFAQGADFTAKANSADAYLRPRSETSGNQSVAWQNRSLGQLDHMVAYDDVVITQPDRHADGQKLVYTADDDKFVLTGGPPSIFDAKQGKITGVSLTFFRTDDRVLVEGEASTPVVTPTRVAQ
jgi:lipopolysaccharide export system protein LptA